MDIAASQEFTIYISCQCRTYCPAFFVLKRRPFGRLFIINGIDSYSELIELDDIEDDIEELMELDDIDEDIEELEEDLELIELLDIDDLLLE